MIKSSRSLACCEWAAHPPRGTCHVSAVLLLSTRCCCAAAVHVYTTRESPHLADLAVGDQVQITATVGEWYGQCVLAPRRVLCVSAPRSRGVHLWPTHGSGGVAGRSCWT